MKLPERIHRIGRVGLTGSMGTGKTTAANALRRLGVGVVCADEVAREVVAPGSVGLAEVAAAFGRGVLTPDGALDRAALAALVFADPKGRKRLEAIIHPLVAAEAERRLSELQARDPGSFVVYDVPLLFENGLEKQFDLTVVVHSTREAQHARVKARSGLSMEEIESRLNAQLEIAEKVRRADMAIGNDGTIADLERKVAELVEAIRARNSKKG